MKTIHWGMIGTGSVTEVKSGPALSKAEHSTLYAVTNRTLAKAQDYAKRHGVPKVYDSVETLLADPQIDIVYIATPPNAHKELAKQCAIAGKPCYIEKPLGLHLAECQDIQKTLRAHGTKGFVAYYRRRLPRFLKVKELMDQQAIGDVRYVHVSFSRATTDAEKSDSWRVQPAVSGGGIFMDIAVHQLDILNFFCGRINQVKSILGNQGHFYEPEDMLNICFSFETGIQGSGDWCFTAGVAKDLIEIVGSKGRISLECFGTGVVVVETAAGVKEYLEPTPVHIQQPLIQSIVAELNGCGQCPSTVDTALETAWVCEEVYKNTSFDCKRFI